LRRITLSATRITEETINLLATNAPNLTYLDLTSCVRAVTDTSLPVIKKNPFRFILLIFFFKVLWKSLKHLRELHLDYCSGLTDSALIQSENKDSIASNLPSNNNLIILKAFN